MPPKSKRQWALEGNLEKARDSKRVCLPIEEESQSAQQVLHAAGSARPEPETLSDLLTLSDDALDTDDEAHDPTFDLDESIMSDHDHMEDNFCEQWVSQLDWEDRTSLGLFLCFQLKSVLGKGDIEAAELAGLITSKSDKTIRDWRSKFVESGGSIPESKQGAYQRTGIMWTSETLNKKATTYIRENAARRGAANLTAASFCQWVNCDLLPNETLEPGFPRKIGVETA